MGPSDRVTPPDPPLKRHPLSAVWPDLNHEETRALDESMSAQGFDEGQPVVRYEGMVLDGWHRYRKALQLDIEPVFMDYAGDDPAGFVISRHKARRHISKEEIAEAVLRCREWLPAGRPRKPDQDDPVSEPKGAPRTNQQLAEEAGVSIGTLKRAKRSVREEEPTVTGSRNRAKSPKRPPATRQRARRARDETERSGLEKTAPENGATTAPTEPGHATPEDPSADANAYAGRLHDVGARLASLREDLEAALTEAVEAAGDGEAWDVARQELGIDEWLRFLDRVGIKVTWEPGTVTQARDTRAR